MTESLPEIEAAHARRFLVRRHLLAPPRSLPARRESVLDVVRTLGSLQFDPLEAPGARNHDLVLHARVRGYNRGWCETWLYGPDRRLFEAYNKSLNILPIEELPYYRVAWDRAAERYRERVFGVHAEAVVAVLAQVTREGVVTADAVSKLHAAPVDWHWAPTSQGRAVLEALFETGALALARREGNKRFYDLTERLFPAGVLARREDPAVCLQHKLLSRHRAVGLMGVGGATELVVGTGPAAERARATAALIDAGVLVPMRVEGVRGVRHVLREELPLLEKSARISNRSPAVTLLAPLDPLMWDRRLVRELFAFEYTWEVYTPAAARQHGYYVLPLLFGDRIVGRIEPRFDRTSRTLRIVGLHFERGFDPDEPSFAPAFVAAMRAYQSFVGADRVTCARRGTLGWAARALQPVVAQR